MNSRVLQNLVISLSLLSSFNAHALGGIQAFEKMKTLVGVWKSEPKEGKYDSISYELIAADSALMERAGNMVTMYYLDGDKLMATHFCEAKNQPRLVATTDDATNIIQFNFLDITNAKPEEPHIHSARFVFDDGEHLTQHWTWYANGKEQGFDFVLTKEK